ncbi:MULTISPECIES: DUF421 domain-containing protein [Salimicrobium]|uniref:YetF C-terminal domain-containing protein n=1 Tax=Salimicrobium humidisoli TaxID=2029857 RepID=A0ABX4HVP6_9BACI|nr:MULTISPECIES: YetF domain-containing protein [Salimicrobium]PBB06909.1 hypothetical protein CKW00_00160 [Salimicrobium humidisoli]
MFFDNWTELWNILLKGIIIYPSVILLLRLTGKRTPSTFNIFDWIITVAFGTLVGSFLITKDISLAEGFLALGLLNLLQFLVTWISVRSKTFAKLVKSQPVLLFYEGEFYPEALRKTRIAEVEVLQVARQNGIGSLSLVEAVVLETNGGLSIIKKVDGHPLNVLANVKILKE